MVDSVIWTPIDDGYLAAVKNPWDAGSSGAVPLRLIKTARSGEVVWTKTFDDADGSTRTVALEVPGGGAVGYLVAGGAGLPGRALPAARAIMIGGTGNVSRTAAPEVPGGALSVTSAVAAPAQYAVAGTVYAGGPHDGWLVLMDPAGNVTSTHSFGGDATDTISALAATGDGGYVLAGTTRSFGETGRTTAPGRAPGFGVLAAVVACGLGLLCRGVRRG